MSWRPRLRHVSATAILLSLMFYQNCAQNQDASLDSQQSYQQNLPFAYKATIDTISYMSCSNITDTSYDPRAYFSIRVGAYTPGTSGLAMSTDFYNATADYVNTNRGEALANSTLSAGALLSVSIRSEANYQQLWQTSTVASGATLDALLPQLDSPQVAGPLVSTQGVLNYFPGSQTQRLMEGNLRFMDLEDDANRTRNTLSSDTSIMVVGYSGSSDPLDQTLRSPLDLNGPISGVSTQPTYTSSQTNANTIFGTGYKLQFGYPTGFTAGDKRVLSTNGILEKNLSTGHVSPSSNWTCDPNYQFMVVRPEDIASKLVFCNTVVDRPTTAAQADALNKIRRVLRVEDWWVDLEYHCVVPKQSGDYCYGDPTYIGTRQIQYGLSSCVDSASTVSPGTLCPHFVSVCVRNANATAP